jgi:hypothetical protein
MPIYEAAPGEVRVVCDQMLEKYHGELHDAEVTIDLLFASPKADDGDINPESHAIKHHGYPAMAVVKVNAYKLRVQSHADAEMIIDKQRWEELSDEQREALIDHELEHLELKTDKDGNLLRDDLDRPKLRTRLHDHQYGWFNSVARRHGKASLEVQQFNHLLEQQKQMWLTFDAEEPENGFPTEVADVPGNGSPKRKRTKATVA